MRTPRRAPNRGTKVRKMARAVAPWVHEPPLQACTPRAIPGRPERHPDRMPNGVLRPVHAIRSTERRLAPLGRPRHGVHTIRRASRR
jgi:hypothetical protein